MIFHNTSLLVVAMLLNCIPLQAEDFYGSPNGDDENNGSIQHSFASIQRAQESILPGNKVFIRGGIYSIAESQFAMQERIWFHLIRLNKSSTVGKRINYFV